MYDLFNPPPPRFVWAVLLISLFAAPSCSHWVADVGPKHLERRVQQRTLNAEAAEQVPAHGARGEPRPGVIVLAPDPVPAPASEPVEPTTLAKLCAGGNTSDETFERGCGVLNQAGWAKTASRVALGSGVLIVLLILVAGQLARGRKLLRRLALVEGWRALRWLTTFQLITNTALGLWGLYWGAVLFLGFQPGLFSAGFAGLVALCALAVTLGLHGHATLNLSTRFDHAEVLGPEDAPELFAHLEGLAERAGSTPPDQLIVGVKPGLYMVEGAGHWDAAPLPGRSLYLQVELLKRLEREELDALLLHELAHFVPGAPEQPRSLHQPYRDVEQVRAKTYDGFLSPANAAIRLYGDGVLSGSDEGRLRSERAADALASELSSPETLSRALLKATALQTFHDRTQDENIEQEIESGSAPSLCKALQEGFDAYSRSRQLVRDVRGESLSHPQDFHLPLEERLEMLGEATLLEHLPPPFFGAPRSSWFKALKRGEELERALWRGMERSEAAERAEEAEWAEEARRAEEGYRTEAS